MRAVNKGLLILVIALLCLGAWSPYATAQPIIIEDTLSGKLLFPGVPHENDDGSVTYVGVTYTGVATGDLPGRWAMILAVTYPADAPSTGTGDATGVLAVGNSTAIVYGTLVGTMDPTSGSFSLPVVVRGGFGPYAGMGGTGQYQGSLTNEGEKIEGSLSLFLTPMEAKGRQSLPERVEKDINRAMSLLKP